jgi:hypothetical protein
MGLPENMLNGLSDSYSNAPQDIHNFTHKKSSADRKILCLTRPLSGTLAARQSCLGRARMDDLDLDRVINDPAYRRQVIALLNGSALDESAAAEAQPSGTLLQQVDAQPAAE